MSEPAEGTVTTRRGKRPTPWLADLVAAAYREDDEAIAAAAAHLDASERRDLDHALMVLVRALLNQRMGASARRRITLTVEPEDG